MPAKTNLKKQSGFALLTVLLVVALITMVSSELLYEQQVQIKRSSFMIHQSNSMSVAFGFESWVKKGLKADADDNKVDHLKELWAQPMAPIDFEGGLVSGELIDLQSRLNLNNLMVTDEATHKYWQTVLERYLQNTLANTAPNINFQGFGDVLSDWIDADDEPRTIGVESSTYLLNNPAYRAANQPLVMVSEIQNLQGMNQLSEQQLFLLTQKFSALPAVVPINVNTVSEDLLAVMTDWMSESIAKQWILQRSKEPAESVDEFIVFLAQATGFDEVEVEQSFPNGVLAVNTGYFLLKARIDYGDVKQVVTSIFRRNDNNQVVLVQRWLSVD